MTLEQSGPETAATETVFKDKVKQDFELVFNEGLEELRDRAAVITEKFGENVYGKVINVLLHAQDQGPEKIEEVLDLMEKHYDEVLTYQHPEIRGLQQDAFHENKTDTFFYTTLVNTLGLKAASY